MIPDNEFMRDVMEELFTSYEEDESHVFVTKDDEEEDDEEEDEDK
ncbi:hypothetical protein [Macrococcoides caseolyticum]|nr:hypothetical protein [Macrococcus caseolyticus]